VALIVPDVANHFYAVLARGAHDTLKMRGFHIMLGSTDADGAEERYFLREMATQRAAGAVIIPFQLDAHSIRKICGSIPVVASAQFDADAGLSQVTFDDQGGAFQAAAYLLSIGRQKVAYIGGAPGTSPAARRHRGYVEAHTALDLQPDPRLEASGDWRHAGGASAMAEILARNIPFDAVFAANDLMAIGALSILRRAGRRVPDDVAVVGFDDIDEAAITEPALTTVHQPAYEMGQRLAELLLAQIDGQSVPGELIITRGTLIFRASA
jgi:DNA-binding LacI/PurR family transcriptional regulator